MFTGIVTAIGTVRAVTPTGEAQDMRLVIAAPPDFLAGTDAGDAAGRAVAIGASIACSGCCLTAVARGEDWFAAQASGETLSRTTLGRWSEGTRINLERSLRVGDELGGHMVSGHVDGVGTLISTVAAGESRRLLFGLPPGLARFVAPKGSIAVDGVSLTVNEVEDSADGFGRFGINIIPHTAAVTTLGALAHGDRVNIEIDMLARYVARLAEAG